MTSSIYEAGDIIQIFPDNYVFDGNDLANGREEVNLGALSESEIKLLTMLDERISSHSAIGQVPAFRNMTTRARGTKVLHRRKYYMDGTVKLKPNAQEQ